MKALGCTPHQLQWEIPWAQALLLWAAYLRDQAPKDAIEKAFGH